MKKKKRGNLAIFIALLLVFITIIGINAYNIVSDNTNSSSTAETNTIIQAVKKATVEDSETEVQHLRDKSVLYENDDLEPIVMYLTVTKGNDVEGTNHTWNEVNTYSAFYYDELGIDRYKVNALLQVGTEEGIPAGSLGYGRTKPNATVQIRGQTSSYNVQKNYKIEFKKDQGSWNGQKTIALNKHQTDGLRFRNKMGYDLLKDVDQLMSLRTQFVHLYVNDLTDGYDDGFEDYGLYTQVEQLNKTALRTHGLDKYGQLYKINLFEFFKYEDVIKLKGDSSYDAAAFEELLEVKGDNDHYKLMAMLDDLNDESMPIEEVLDRHFDRENLTYWLAFNILTGNADTQSRNAYLYSPKNSDIWYFLCWDLDGMFRYTENQVRNINDYGSWEIGVSNYWGNVLFRRCLQSEDFRKELDDAINDLRTGVLSKESLTDRVDAYRKVVETYTWAYPDMKNEVLTKEQYDVVADSVPDLVDKYYQQYLVSLERPMPFFLGVPTVIDGRLRINWSESFDFQQEPIRYKVVLSTDLYGQNIIGSYEGSNTEFYADIPGPGEYFIIANAYDASGNSQDCFDYYLIDGLGKVYGTLPFYVNQDGTIEIYEVTE